MTTSAVGALWDEAVQKVAERLAPARARIAPAAEAALLGRIRAGDDRACELLVHDAAGQLLATARRLLRCEQDALDVVRETFSAAFGSVGGVSIACGLAGTLHQLLIHTALSKVRQAAVHRGRGAEPLLPRFDARGGHVAPVEDWVPRAATEDAGVVAERVRAAISGLALGFRASLVLHDAAELTTEEAAVVLDLTPAEAKTRLHRARQALRGALANTYANV